MTTPSTPMVLAAQSGPYAEFRMGTVVSFATNQAVVSIGGTNFSAAYLVGASFTAGDLVYVSRQDASWVIHGALAGVGPNELIEDNPSFEDSAPGAEPVLWFQANVSGSSGAVVQEVTGAPDGTQVASVGTTDTAAAVHYLYSQPIPVTSGWQFSVSASAAGDYQPTDTPTADAALVALWFANNTDLWPTTSSADTVIVSAVDLVQQPLYTTLSGTVSAPVSGYMRLALRSSTAGLQRLFWDNVIMRRV
ncbi:hypothetical protein [Streptosporangium amethystogenes]|uniref:hypothetical protein n=1 Tax=Streptosporangium amethystogenes TaxID=2002 RepID=UPI000B2A0765|nr:hypothetical protein [Streptosporangium amethystogenes]